MDEILSKLSKKEQTIFIKPLDVFKMLTGKKYEYPRDVQSQIWEKWFEVKNKKNNIIKMNTGSGKTVVGLVILQSCLNEKCFPAVYVVPDKYLAEQVRIEAANLGIIVTDNENDYMFRNGKSILITNIHKVFNAKSVFGMRDEKDSNINIGSIVIDDVHTCLEKIKNQYTISIEKSHEAYNEIFNLIKDELKMYYSTDYIDIVEYSDPRKRMIVPFWIWQDKKEKIYNVLKKYDKNTEACKSEFFFKLALISDKLELCNCIITSDKIEIMPIGFDVSKISSFNNAKRRIFMSATITDDSIFSEVLDIEKDDLQNVIVPKYINDIGDRLILAPQLLNNDLTDESIIDEIKIISNEFNTVVIVPSYERAKKWDPTGESIIDKDNIEQAIQDLKSGNKTLKILVNRYDGIDLPGDACRVLVIDGLPNFEHEYDKYLKSINPNSDYLLRSRMSKIEQGMGRGVRSASDYCCIFLMGSQLLSIFRQSKIEDYFSKAMCKQFQLSKDMWDSLLEYNKMISLADIIELKKYCLGKDEISKQWKEMSRECIMDLEYDKNSHIDDITLLLRKAYNSARIDDIDGALTLYEMAKKEEVNDSHRRGYIMQLKSMVENIKNRSQAQETLKAAKEINNSLLKPIDGIIYTRKDKRSIQEENIYDYVSKITNINEELNKVCDTFGKLSFSSDSDDFEYALCELGNLLGFDSRRPDKEDPGNGPDNIWISDNKILVFECKNESNTNICKRYCDQLSGEINWANKNYCNYKSYPIIVHKTNNIDRNASPLGDMRVLTENNLFELKKQINSFVKELFNCKKEINNEKIKKLLNSYYLREENFINKYTSKYQQQKK